MKKIYLALLSAVLLFTATIGVSQTANLKTKKYFTFPERIKKGDYQEKTVVLKVKPQFSNVCSLTNLNNFILELGIEQPLKRKFPLAEKPQREYNDIGLKYADLTRIYHFIYKNEVPLEDVINTIYAMGIAEYAEPNYIMHHFFTPNDPSLSQQWHITKIKCPQAWDINQGDTNVVIGICDNEIRWDHSDLVGNLKRNYADPINGADDDGDGYIDNYNGWDVGEGDNNTFQTSGSGHGSHVTGCADEATNNGIMGAGPGFKCKFLPVKIANSSDALIAGYEGIQYAADHGAKIINCSWGSAGGGGSGQDVIDYATINKDALVVAAAGNDGVETEFFPAAYTYVLTVAASTSTDKKSSFSNYGTWIDLASPGSGINATYAPNTFASLDGTSMASPVAAGSAAIIKSMYPFLNGIQVGEQLKMTCDPMPTEAQYNAGKLGKGRINLFTAVSGITKPSVVMTAKNITDNGDEAFVTADTLDITATFVNYLLATGNLTATLTAINSTPTYVTIVDGTTALGSIAMMGTANNNADPFRVVLKAGIPVNSKADFKVTITDGSYTTTAYISFTINVDYINIAINEVATSITSKSLIGFNDFSTQLEGLGFRYIPGGVAENLLFDGGLMVGVPGKVSDCVRKTGGGTDTDFGSVIRVAKIVPPVASEFDVKGVFNDDPAGATVKIPVQVSHKAYAWNTPGHKRYVIVEYSIKNTGTADLSGVYAGIYTDWDINMGSASGYNNNKASTDVTRNIGYTYNIQQDGFYAGVQMLTSSTAGFYHYAMNHNETGSFVNPNTAYATADKYTTLSTMRTDAGAPNDVSSVVSGGPFNIVVGDSAIIAFAILAGDNLTDLQKSADSACAQYPFNLLASTTSPACGSSNGTATVSVVGCGSMYSYLWSNGQTTATATGLSAGNYTVTVTNPSGRIAASVVSVSNSTAPAVSVSSTNVSCGNTDGSANVSASGGQSPYTYLWNNGATTATINNLAVGNYLVSVTDANNCLATASVMVNSSSNLTVTVSATDANCGSSNGTATANVVGGLTPYTYLWSNSATTPAITGLAAATYTVTVTDATSCSIPVSITVNSNSGISISTSVVDASAVGVCDGSATVSASGGNSPYTFLWSDANAQTTATATGLCAANYSVTVTDASGCTSTSSAIVLEPTAISSVKTSEQGFRVYPNPASSTVNIYFSLNSNEKKAKFSIYNVLGKEIYQSQISNLKSQILIDVSSFESGIYFCRFNNSEGVFTKKLTVVK